ncbi:hypothetical protein J3L11_17285, partial [Shewanella sp. 4t3-1-2LB]|uniref:hypothetical protein n=1 Tax=Shewanella sp. 4t3-1-2LB TaxID=2817682 RepID=UPI001A9870EF
IGTKLKNEKDEVSFYYPFLECKNLESDFIFYTINVIHELFHVELFYTNKYKEYTMFENEYWAHRISYCYILKSKIFANFDLKYHQVSFFERYFMKYIDFNELSISNLALRIFQSDLVDYMGRESISEDDKDLDRLYEWCSTEPPH